MKNKNNGHSSLPIVIIGAGPIGLAAASHLAKAGEDFIVLEAGPHVGHHVLQWGHVRLFSPWQYNIDKVARELLEEEGWETPAPDVLPTGKELVENYLLPVAELPQIGPSIRLNTKVISISRKGLDKMKTANREDIPFVLYMETQGLTKMIEAKAVIDATGTWGQPNPMNSAGVWTTEEKSFENQIFYGIPNVNGKEYERYVGKRVAVIGGGHSAINTILELSELNEKHPDLNVTWILRKKNVEEAYGGEEKDALQARGELGLRIHQLVNSGRVQVYTPYRIHSVEKNKGSLKLNGELNGESFSIEGLDELIVNTGSHPDFSFLSEVRLNIDAATESISMLAPLIDPNLHSCGTVRPHGEEELRQPEKNLYIVGMKSYGRAPTFLMATGYEQVRSVVAYLTGDFESAKNVELDLPDTGVCSINLESTKKDETCCNTITGNC
ncbi:FAD-dependent oxidoreductase [Sporosarcina gallistercoris]|uniref:NAD(P)-binding domain-containing protein n=1 Tax=Sporosarcina gallistercoris TaxID=2762245 RepID=A0ABR8PHY1_9BACL|nr:FAD-dependent oxidoreductase [Sporosarcina gallistercoris]MBD7907778.1 NAD(P)-binding domain-containing protein [Sporosarcina gallistercoris]